MVQVSGGGGVRELGLFRASYAFKHIRDADAPEDVNFNHRKLSVCFGTPVQKTTTKNDVRNGRYAWFV